MTRRLARTTAAALALSALLAACGGAAKQPTEAPAEPSGTSSAAAGPDASACERLDVAALEQALQVQFDDPEQYGEVGATEGCALVGTDVSLALDLLSEHGTIEEDVELAKTLGTEKPEALEVAGHDALFIHGQDGHTWTGLVAHVGDRLLLVNGQDHGGDGRAELTRLTELTTAAAEMAAAAG